MRNRKTPFHYLILILLPAFYLTACSKDKADAQLDNGTSYLSVRMIDAPAGYDSVLVDIIGFEVKMNGSGTTFLNLNPGIYNLLDYVNGVDTLIASGGLPSGRVQQIRLILGNANRVVVNGVSYPLSTPSAMQSGLKLQVHKELLSGISYQLLLDFDAHQSIVTTGNGEYILKPVIRVVDQALNGSVTGSVLPVGLICVITLESGGNQYSSVTDLSGSFLVAGVPAGVYNLSVTPPSPYAPVTLTGVVVTNGQITNVGQILL